MRRSSSKMSNLKKYDVVVFGSCIIDFICYVPRIPNIGETIHGTKFKTGYGGKGGNQAVAAARMGASTAMIANVGSDEWGPQYKINLFKEMINVDNVKEIPEETTGIAQIFVSDKGENQIAIVTGANDTLNILDVMKAEEMLKCSKVLVCQLETSVLATIEALALFNGISILNGAPAIEKYHDDLLKFPTIFCVNETEAAIFAGVKAVDLGNVKKTLETLIQKGCNVVIITLGELGAVFNSKNDPRPIHVRAPKVIKAIDTTGAGDAFIGALAYFLSQYSVDQMSMTQKVGAACEIASISVQHLGTQSSFPKLDDTKIYLTKKYEWNYL